MRPVIVLSGDLDGLCSSATSAEEDGVGEGDGGACTVVPTTTPDTDGGAPGGADTVGETGGGGGV